MNMTNQQQFTPEQSQQATEQIRAALQEANLPAEKLVEIGQWAQQVINDPNQFPAFQAWLRDQGLGEEDIPKEPDYQELTAMVAVGHVAADMVPAEQPAPQSAAPAAPISPEQLAGMAGQGRNGDTMLAHINPQEAAVLKQMGGTGTINPATGLPEFGFFSDLWRGIKSVAKTVAPFVLPVVAIAFPALIPAIGTALGASAALAPVVGAAVISGGMTAISGGSIKDVLSSAALTGLGAYLSPIVGKYVGNLTGVTDLGLQSALGSATLAGGMTALRGGTVSQILTSAATGAAANYLGQVATNAINGGQITNTRITQKTFDDAVFAAADAKGLADAGLGKNQITEILTGTGLPSTVASTAAAAAVTGATADSIAVALSNTYGSSKTLYTNNATGAQQSIIGGGNVKALETVQRAEDALFVAQDAKNLRAAGLNEAAITQNLMAQGVPQPVASMAASEAYRGATLDAVAQSIVYAGNRAGGVIIGEPTGVSSTTGAAPITTSTPAAPVAPTPAPAPQISEDAAFVAADAAQLRAQGLSQDQIQQTLVQSGVSQQAAYQAAYYARTGSTQAEIAARLNTVFGTQDIYTPAAPAAPAPVAPAQPAGGNVSEAEFQAADAAQLAAQTGNNTAAVEQNLTYAGVNPVDAATAANMATSGATTQQIAQAIAPDISYGELINSGQISGQQYEQMASSGLVQSQGLPSATEIQNFLNRGYSMDQITAAMNANPQGGWGGALLQQTPNASVAQTTQPTPPQTATPQTTTSSAPSTPPASQQGVRSWNPISSGGPGTDQGYIITDSAGNQYWTSDDGTLTYQRPAGGFWDRTPIANPASLTPGGNVSEAEFIAADAAQLAAQTGNNTAAIEQNLIYAGVDPITAATAANMAASGATTQQIADAISADVTAPAPVSPTAPSTQEPGGTGITADNLPAGEGYELVGPAPIPPGGDMGGGTGLLPPTYPNLPDMGGGQGLIVPGVTPEIITPPLTPEPPAITDSQIGAIVAAPTIPNPLEPPPTPGRPDMGSFTPAPPDASWSTPLQYPGVNPGLVGGAVRPAYQTTSPVQSQYYWGRQPYFAYTEDLANYNQVAMPSQPWGQQQGYFEQPLALPQIPVYGENMFVQPRAFAQPQVQDYFAPSLNMPQYMLPPQIPQMVPNSPNYIYDIRPTAGQYSVPGSSPV